MEKKRYYGFGKHFREVIEEHAKDVGQKQLAVMLDTGQSVISSTVGNRGAAVRTFRGGRRYCRSTNTLDIYSFSFICCCSSAISLSCFSFSQSI